MTSTEKLRTMKRAAERIEGNLTTVRTKIAAMELTATRTIRVRWSGKFSQWEMILPRTESRVRAVLALPGVLAETTEPQLWFAIGHTLAMCPLTAPAGGAYTWDDIEIDTDDAGYDDNLEEPGKPGLVKPGAPIPAPTSQREVPPVTHTPDRMLVDYAFSSGITLLTYQIAEEYKTNLPNSETARNIANAVLTLIDAQGVGQGGRYVLAALLTEMQKAHRTCQQSLLGSIKTLVEWYGYWAGSADSGCDLRNEQAARWAWLVAEQSRERGDLGQRFPYI